MDTWLAPCEIWQAIGMQRLICIFIKLISAPCVSRSRQPPNNALQLTGSGTARHGDDPTSPGSATLPSTRPLAANPQFCQEIRKVSRQKIR